MNDDQLRCEFYAEAGETTLPDEQCDAPVTQAVRIKITHGNNTWEDLLYSCEKHALEQERNPGFISREPLREMVGPMKALTPQLQHDLENFDEQGNFIPPENR
jgi:hypothetical protein